MKLYDKLESMGVKMDHHESDLYVNASQEVENLIIEMGYRIYPFLNKIDGETWFDIPFAYLPWWRKRGMECLNS